MLTVGVAMLATTLISMLLIAAQTPLPLPPEDALYPEVGVFTAGWRHEYEAAVARHLVPATAGLRVVFLCSFAQEAGVFVRDIDRASIIELREAQRSIYDAGGEAVARAAAADVRRTEQEADAIGWASTRVDVTTTSAPIDAALRDVLQQVWSAAVRRSSFTRNGRSLLGFDGCIYHFGVARLDAGPAAGWVWEPPAKSRMRDLMAIAARLRTYVTSPAPARAAIRADVMTRSWDLLDRFDPGSSFRAGRPPVIAPPVPPR